MYFVYILENPLERLYIGQTDNVEDRTARHNRGGKKYTSAKEPWSVIYTESFATRDEALKREKYLKSLKNPKYIREHIIASQQLDAR